MINKENRIIVSNLSQFSFKQQPLQCHTTHTVASAMVLVASNSVNGNGCFFDCIREKSLSPPCLDSITLDARLVAAAFLRIVILFTWCFSAKGSSEEK
jgi:hypothetical protein